MTQEEFAHRVGGARQSVNAALRGFERRGWIQVRNQAVTVKQAAALSRFAGDLPAHAKRPPCGQSREAHQAQNVHPGSFGMKVLNFAAGRRITARRDEAAVARREQRRSSLTNEARPTARGARGWLSDSPDARVAAHRQEEAGTRGARGL